MSMAWLSLGCNRGECSANLSWAVKRLDSEELIEVVRISSIYLTEPVGGVAQPDFLNIAVGLETTLSPHDLLDICRQTEEELGGRDDREPMGPRTIDLDILLYEQVQIAEGELILPHPSMLERAFVMVPLAEIAPEVELPDGRTVEQALAVLEDEHNIEKTGALFHGPAPDLLTGG